MIVFTICCVLFIVTCILLSFLLMTIEAIAHRMWGYVVVLVVIMTLITLFISNLFTELRVLL